MNKYMDLISTLAMSQTMPSKQVSVKVTLVRGDIITGVSYSLEEYDIVLNTATGVLRYSLNSIAYIAQDSSITYPGLPPGYNTPDKSAGRSWVINNLRAMLQEVNAVSMAHYGHSVVMTVDMDTGVSLTTSEFWSTLPAHIRHRFLEVLWGKYCTMLECYGVASKYRKLYLWAYNNQVVPIGIRSDYRLMVHGGVEVVFNSKGGV